MKTKKNKAATKLKSLKEKENSANEDVNLLNQEIPFEEHIQNSSRFSQKNEKSEIRSTTSRENSPAVRTSDHVNNFPDREDHTRVMSDRSEDGTLVLKDDDAQNVSNNSETPDESGDSTDVNEHRVHNETTQREVSTRSHRSRETEKISYGDVYENQTRTAGASSSHAQSVDGLLKQSEHLRMAQEKINDLETELDDLRKQNHELSNDAESIATLNESYSMQIENLKMELTHVRLTLGEEAKILRHSMYEKERVIAEMKQTNSDLKSKVENNFKSIRKRERDLEYRLELAKVDEAALLKSKDKMILELRRELEKKDQEKSAFERKNKEHFQKIQEQQQTVRTVVRALRIALTRLEGDFGVDFEVLKKAE